MIRRPPRSTQSRSSAASDVYKRQTPGSGTRASAKPAAPRAPSRPKTRRAGEDQGPARTGKDRQGPARRRSRRALSGARSRTSRWRRRRAGAAGVLRRRRQASGPPLPLQHPAGPQIVLVPGQRLVEQVRRVLTGGAGQGPFEVVLQRRPKVWVDAPVDDAPGPPARRKAAQVGQPLLGDDDMGVVLSLIHI